MRRSSHPVPLRSRRRAQPSSAADMPYRPEALSRLLLAVSATRRPASLLPRPSASRHREPPLLLPLRDMGARAGPLAPPLRWPTLRAVKGVSKTRRLVRDRHRRTGPTASFPEWHCGFAKRAFEFLCGFLDSGLEMQLADLDVYLLAAFLDILRISSRSHAFGRGPRFFGTLGREEHAVYCRRMGAVDSSDGRSDLSWEVGSGVSAG
jgi:hypothetical protein